jgi:rhodanese-related sulfurtransferase
MPKEVGRAEVLRLVEAGAVLVDVLPPREYETEHIRGAVNLPLEELKPERVADLPRDRPIVVYCNDHQ